MKWRGVLALVCFHGFSGVAWSQVATLVPDEVMGAKPAFVEHFSMYAPSLQGNLEGNNVDRDIIVVLPPGYRRETRRRYPVLYALHGYWIGAEQWTHEIHVPQTIEGAFAHGSREFIVVLPDSKTVHNGSMYSRSVTTGDFETFVAVDLVRYIDSHYRTIPQRSSRGLVGHSMGGYGAARIGMKYAQTFGALYLMSPCCLSARQASDLKAADFAVLEGVKSAADSASLPFGLRALLATAAAWSPNPQRSPLFLDLPMEGGAPQAEILAKWAANAPLAFIDQYVGNLRQYAGIALDVGDQDSLRVEADRLHDALNRYGIEHQFEIYPGTHVSAVAVRFQDHVMPFFGKRLHFESATAH